MFTRLFPRFPSFKSPCLQEGVLAGLENLLERSSSRADSIKSALLDRALPADVIDALSNRTGDATACVQLFICRLSPVVWAAQDAANHLSHMGGLATSMGRWWDSLQHGDFMPPSEAVFQFGREECDQRFPSCHLLKFAPPHKEAAQDLGMD